MTSGGQQPQQPERRYPALQHAVLYSVLATVLYLACLICTWGFISLITTTDVINEPVGPLVGPVMAGIACVLAFFFSLFGLRARRPSTAWPRALVAGAAVYVISPLIGGVIVSVERLHLVAGLLFFAGQVTGPYLPAAAILAAIIVFAAPLVRHHRAP